jgi:SAM-dependent methyltransferase
MARGHVAVVHPVDTREFWESKANDYPLPFEARTTARVLPVIKIVQARELVIRKANVLDIGCGTGAFALRLALRGARVTALDISGFMLHRLKQEAQRLKIRALKIQRSSWKDFDIRAHAFEKAFDIVFCGLSTAVETSADIERMERCSKRWCVYAASGKTIRDPWCRKIFRDLHAPVKPRPDIRTIKRRLASMGRSATFQSFTVPVQDRRTPDEVIQVMAARMEAAGRKVSRNRIINAVNSIWVKDPADSSTAVCRGEVEMGVLMWRVNE